ncbi:MAG: PQQ-binding-like beta-propeller repeat protein [Planctomycetaceae bacterium]|nr:PQQ-binding-like beta-propeller repeat protein [Planctomycetaceae bacterium]
MRLSLPLFGLIVLCCFRVLFAEDVFRFRGDNSQGKYNESGLLNRWPEEGLKPKWVNSELGEGWGSVIKVKDRLYLTGLDADDPKRESVICLDLDGTKLWQQPVGAVWRGSSYPIPRTTPTYVVGSRADDDKLLVLSGNGELFCLAANGKPLWQKDVTGIYETNFSRWGLAECVVVKDDQVFVTVCGKKALVVALKIADGSEIWKSEPIDDIVAYVSPALCGNRLIAVTEKYVSMVDIETGHLLWSSDFQQDSGGPIARVEWSNCNPPLVQGNQFFVSQGYNQGGVMYEILPDGKHVNKLWYNKVLDVHHDGAVEVEGRIYGSNWLDNNVGQWACLDWNTGETLYDEAWSNLGKGVTIFADGKLYLYEEKRGTLALASPGDKFEIISSFRMDFGTKEHWPHPVISDGVLYVRRGNSLAAFDIVKK